MHFSHVFLGLVATASAIDLYGYSGNEKCGGGASIVKTNVNPGGCAVRASGNAFRSIQFRAIPTNWNIICQAFNGGDCRNLLFSAQSGGRENICLGGNNYSGGLYTFAGKKRAEGANEACPAEGGCTSVQKFDRIEFEDGPKYNMADLDDDLYAELVSRCIFAIFENDGNSTDVPAKFAAYKIE